MANGKPIAVDDHLSFSENDLISGNLLSNDHDPDSSALYLRFFDGVRVDAKRSMTETQETIVQGEYGTFRLHPDGSFTYQLDHSLEAVKNLSAGEHLTERVTYKMSDGGGATDTGVLDLKINGSDEPPPVRTLLDFDDLPPNGDLPQGYGGFQFKADLPFLTFNTDDNDFFHGYQGNLAYTSEYSAEISRTDHQNFDLIELDIGTLFLLGPVKITATSADGTEHEFIVPTDGVNAKHLVLDWEDIDSVHFDVAQSSIFAFDNILVG